VTFRSARVTALSAGGIELTASRPHFLWHNAIHEEWADEKLIFLFLASEPTYNRETAIQRVKDFLERHQICSYQIYELTAPYDLLVRAWVPKGMQRHELKEGIRNEDSRLRVQIAAEVMEIIHHWPWASTRRAKIGKMRKPTKAVLERELPIQELEAINAMQCGNGKGRTGDPPVLRKKYKDARILSRPDYRPGIRFLVLVKMLDPEQWESLGDRIRTLLDKAKAVIRDPSLYRLDDAHQFLIFGQVNQGEGSFHAISSRLVSHINDYAAPGGARTYSVFFPIPGFLAFRDELRLPEPDAPTPEVDVEDLLQRPESDRLEIKGSAFTELSAWVRGQADAPVTSEKPVNDDGNRTVNTLLRAIASLLNARGGHVVLGALETSKFGSFDRFQEMPSTGTKGLYRCCGIECDYGDGGFDEFERRLRDLIEKRFDPAPSGRMINLRFAEFQGRDLCVVDVATPDSWFWVNVGGKGGGKKRGKRKSANLEPKFFVREGGGSKELRGREIDVYKQENPRKGF
jgi:hypothetical protein